MSNNNDGSEKGRIPHGQNVGKAEKRKRNVLFDWLGVSSPTTSLQKNTSTSISKCTNATTRSSINSKSTASTATPISNSNSCTQQSCEVYPKCDIELSQVETVSSYCAVKNVSNDLKKKLFY